MKYMDEATFTNNVVKAQIHFFIFALNFWAAGKSPLAIQVLSSIALMLAMAFIVRSKVGSKGRAVTLLISLLAMQAAHFIPHDGEYAFNPWLTIVSLVMCFVSVFLPFNHANPES